MSNKTPEENQAIMNNVVLVEEIKTDNGTLGLLILNAEKSLNSITLEMVNILTSNLKKWASDDHIKAVIIRGQGNKAFCAGGDVQALYQSAMNPKNGVCHDAECFFLNEYRLDYMIHTYDKPIVCFGNGIVMGGGLGLMAGASHRIVTETSRIAMPEVTIGLFPDVGSTVFLNQIPYNLGYFFALTGAQMNANDALFCKLADYAIQWKQYDDILECLKSVAWTDSDETNHQLVSQLFEKKSCATDTLPESNIKQNLAILEKTCRHNSLSRILEAIQQLESDNIWLSKAKDSLNNGSELSSIVIYEQLKRHLYVDLHTAFISEYTLMCNMIKQADFKEGVRALLVDKDKNPKWVYPSVSHVTSTELETLFTHSWEIHPLNDIDVD